jgi:hypothetical protein
MGGTAASTANKADRIVTAFFCRPWRRASCRRSKMLQQRIPDGHWLRALVMCVYSGQHHQRPAKVETQNAPPEPS